MKRMRLIAWACGVVQLAGLLCLPQWGYAQTNEGAEVRSSGGGEVAPIPAAKTVFTWKEFNREGREWMEKVLLSNYKAYGTHAPEWDEKLTGYLKLYADFQYGEQSGEQLKELKALGEVLMALGCSDPCIVYFHGNVAHQLGDPKQALPIVRRAR